jgi:hemimethylated DNA binding protein
MISASFQAGKMSRGGTTLRRLTSAADNSRLGRNLYRQLIRWCRNTDKTIPLSSFVPPVTLKPPHVEQESLQNWEYFSGLLPPHSKVQAHQMTVPIATSEDAANLFRVIFRMNREETNHEVFKQRISTAFEALKSLNQLSGGLASLQEHREKHLDRDGVLYCVGQVVQHKTEKWRGIITGWERSTMKGNGKLTSLTKKDYDENIVLDEEPAGDSGDIQYSLIIDSGDAHLLGGRRNIHDITRDPVAMQSDLELVKDECLLRIRSNWTPRYFDRFDSSLRRFVLNAVRNFEYPLDNNQGEVKENESLDTVRRNELGGVIVDGVQQFASRLKRKIFDVTSCSESRGLGLLSTFEEHLTLIENGDVVPDSAFLSPMDLSKGDLAAYHLRQLLNLTLEISEMLWIRQLSQDNKERIRFSLGQIVQHKKYGFRGVIMAWDPKPAVDVTHWDGLTDIENASDLPFYHIVPDQKDCIEAFGAERPFRYVCEANLEECPAERSFIDVDISAEKWSRRPTEAKYDVPDDARFKYAEDSEEDNVTAECLTAIMDDISRLQLSIREPSDSVDSDLSDIASKLSLENLFEMLKLADKMDSATVYEETIKEAWKANSNHKLRSKLDDGIADLMRGNKERALTIFLEIIREDPAYGEAWNKASTAHYMMGDMQSALETAEKTLDLIPFHFQALNGLGLIQYDTRRYKLSAQSFRRSLTLDPWSPVSSRLSACLDMLHGTDLEDEQGNDR